MMRSAGCRVVARASGTRTLAPIPRRWIVEETARALLCLVLLAALCGALVELWAVLG